ncbi:MAG: tetratricopeptide repeat protein [Candidatus Thorarchaeota archaeon]
MRRLRNWARKERAFRLLSKSIEFEQKGNYKAAEDTYLELTSEYPEFEAGLTSYAIFLHNRGRGEAAKAMLREAAWTNEASPDALRQLGFFLMSEGLKIEAIECFREAVSREPDDVSSWNNIAELSVELGLEESAEEAYAEGVRIHPDDSFRWERLGDFQQRVRKYEESIHSYQKALQFNKRGYVVWVKLGVVLLIQDRLDEALNAYENATTIEPYTDFAINNLGVKLEEIGLIDLSTKRAELSRIDRRARQLFTISLSGLGSMPKAEAKYRKLAKESPKHAGFLHTLGQCMLAQSKYEEAETTLRMAIRIDPFLTAAWCNLGIALLKQNRVQEAREALSRAIETDPKDQESARILESFE